MAGPQGPLRVRDPPLYLLCHRLRRASVDNDLEVRDLLVEGETPLIAALEALPARRPEWTPGVPGPAEQDADVFPQEDRRDSSEPLAVFGALDDPAAASDDPPTLTIERVEQRAVFQIPEVLLTGDLEDLRYRAAVPQRDLAVEVDEVPAEGASENAPDSGLAATHVADDGDGSIQAFSGALH